MKILKILGVLLFFTVSMGILTTFSKVEFENTATSFIFMFIVIICYELNRSILDDESFNFQDIQGLELNADIGITYRIAPKKVPLIFEKYKKGIDEITDIFLRNMVRDALNETTSQYNVTFIYGKGKAQIMNEVEKLVKDQVEPLGIILEKLYWIGRIKLPKSVKEAVDMKIKATQLAQQKENELRQSTADSKKRVVDADGRAQSILLTAKAQAQANILLSNSITQKLVEYEKIKRWDGKLPHVSGANALISIK